MSLCAPKKLSVVLPARNEGKTLTTLLPELVRLLPGAEIIVVNDGSLDSTELICHQHNIKVISHPYPMGNGAAIKSGIRSAVGEVLILMDADGQHQVGDIPRLLDKFNQGYDMVVGARMEGSHAGLHRAVANDVFSRFASWMVNQKVEDLTSGFRVVNAKKIRQFLYLLPNGFSYPTTSTMCFFRAGYAVAYEPIHTPKRIGESHIKPIRDGVRFLLIIIKIGTLFSPLKLFLPISLGFLFAGFSYYIYTFISYARFTNMSALLLTTGVLVFLIGLISEQITAITFKDTSN
jgi:glycosyltransferase involved in cell wall biosynthesis